MHLQNPHTLTPSAEAATQAALRCVAPRLLWSSVVGAHGNETGHDDAFATVLDVLQKRKLRAQDSAQQDSLSTEVRSR